MFQNLRVVSMGMFLMRPKPSMGFLLESYVKVVRPPEIYLMTLEKNPLYLEVGTLLTRFVA
jgi:hypothetical protein